MTKLLVASAAAVLIISLSISSVTSEPVQACTENTMFIADDEDLCRYHWCIGTADGPIEWRCPPGARVPTWFETAPTDDVIPCIIDHSTDTSCLRCKYGADERAVQDGNDCSNNPCSSGCTCQDLWEGYFCLCPDNAVPIYEGAEERATAFCNSNPCENGATCHSQWDTYWCECPRGFTGKNCEVFFCNEDTCMNGGVCTVDSTNYHCECSQCFDGPCCQNRLGNGRNCEGVAPPGVQTPPTTKRTTRRTNPPTYPPITRPSTPAPPQCNECQYGDRCQNTKDWLCSCNPCQSGQICYDRQEPNARECLGKPGPYGSQYTLTFSQDVGGGSQFKRVYVNVGGMSIVGSHQVRIYTPNLRRGEPCFVDMTVTISINKPAHYDVPAQCLNTESGQVENRKVLKVLHVEGKEIVVTVSNMDGDGYLAIPDSMAGLYFVSHSYDKAGEDHYITVVALNDGTQVLIQKPDEEVFSVMMNAAAPQSNVVTFNLNALESVRYLLRGGNLFGTVIVSNKDIHVWTGNQDRQSQKSQEQLATVNRWGPGGEKEYVYIVVGVSDSTINTFDEVHVETAVPTDYTLFKVGANGQKNQVARGSLAANSMIILGELREGEIFELVTRQPVQVTHNIRANNSGGKAFYSAYALIPAIQQYAQSYSLQTHGERDRVGNDFTRHYLTLVAMRGAIQDAPAYFEQIVIYHHNPATGVTTTYTPKDLGARWVNVRGFYDGVRIELPQTGVYYLSNPSLDNYAFGAIYYAVSSANGRSAQPQSSFPLGCRLDRTNNIRPPVICNRCMSGPKCNIPIVHTCACNPCANFDDICTDGSRPAEARTCLSVVDTTGNPFTLMFMQNRPDNTEKRELEIYATPAGTASQLVRVFTPFLTSNDRCFLDTEKRVNGFEVSLFSVPNPDCYETIGSGTFNDKALRVQSDGGDLLVYAVNRDEFSADGWVAFPDSAAGRDFYAVCYSPPTYGTEFAVLNIQDEPVTITLTYAAGGNPDISGTRFTLQGGEVLQIQSSKDKSDLSGTRIQSSMPVNVYSGNIRAKVALVEDPAVGNINTGSRDHLVEQLMPVTRWGTVFHIQPIPDRRFGDQVKVVGSQRNTACTIARRDPSGQVTVDRFTVSDGGLFTRDVISGNTYRIMCDNRVFVAQITKSQERGFNIHDPSLITVPPVEQYANRYIFNTPSFSGGTGAKRPYGHRLVLISARAQDRDGIEIIHSTSAGGSTTKKLSDMGTWMQVPGTDYYNIVGELEVGTSLILHRSDSVSFMCIFYGYDDRESLGFPIGMKLQVIDQSDLLAMNQ